jgi:hypothetical protein
LSSDNEIFLEIANILSSKGEEYNSLYPLIKEPNVFSISTTSFSAAKQLSKKLRPSSPSFLSLPLTKGKAMHEFIQKRLVEKNWVVEYEIIHNVDDFRFLGHIDAIHFERRIILEFKTTKLEDFPDETWNSWINQLGTYVKIVELQRKEEFSGYLCVISDTFNIYKILREEIEMAYNEIVKRGKKIQSLMKKEKGL